MNDGGWVKLQEQTTSAKEMRAEGKSNAEIAEALDISEKYVALIGETTIMAKFDDRSRNWSPDPDINVLFVTSVFNYMADRLKAVGHVFLNEMFDQLGLPRTSKGQLVGWLYSDKETWWMIETSSENDDIVLKFFTHGVMYDKIEEEA